MMEMMMYAKHNKKITHPCSVARALEELCMMCCFRVFFSYMVGSIRINIKIFVDN